MIKWRPSKRLAATVFTLLLVLLYVLPVLSGMAEGFASFGPFLRNPSLRLLHSSVMGTDLRAQAALQRSLLDSALSAVFGVAVAGMGVCIWRRSGSRMRRLVSTLCLMPLVVPEVGTGVALPVAARQFGICPGPTLHVISGITACLPIAYVVLLLGQRLLPGAYGALAFDAGYSNWMRLSGIVGPTMARPVLASLLFSCLLSFNEYTRSFFCHDREVYATYIKGALASGGAPHIYALVTCLFVVMAGVACYLTLKMGAGDMSS
jgi:ABC-type spermidine/putrescine transport system permease subunit II